jgi:hypothetical protein
MYAESRNSFFQNRYSLLGYGAVNDVSVATIIHATVEELWEAVFSVGPCRGYIWKIETQLRQK